MQLRDPARARASGVRGFYYLFGLLHLAGRDVTALPPRERKALHQALSFADPSPGGSRARTTLWAEIASDARSLREAERRLARLSP